MTQKPRLSDEYNPLLPGLSDDDLLKIFIRAAEKGVIETLQLMPLEKQRQFLNMRAPGTGQTALVSACMNGHGDVVDHLLALKPDLEAHDKQGWTPLAWASWRGNIDLMTKLLDAGAKVDARDSDSWTPLCDAINGGKPAAVLLLLKRGANPMLKNGDGMTPLEMAQDVKMNAVIAPLESVMREFNRKAIRSVMGHLSSDLPAPPRAQFKKRPPAP